MISFPKQHEYLICIDSDGTIMDTMTIKHVRSFGPEFLVAFEINEHQEDILTEWNRLNLYSKTRGINRFQGLKAILEYVNEKYNYSYLGFDEFANWVLTTKELSMKSLIEATNNASIKDTMLLAQKWSNLVNESINKLPETSAFEGVKEILHNIENKVDLLGVSSANAQAVNEEWNRLGFYSCFKEVACQDKGTKKEIISQALLLGYNPKHVVMLGDAIGDLKAAQDNGVYFYPIIPGKENQSWERFSKEVIEKILKGEFDEEYQKQLIEDFYNSLQ